MLPMWGVVWFDALESTSQSATYRRVVIAMVLKEIARDCLSQSPVCEV
jgi:hypothetical protein